MQDQLAHVEAAGRSLLIGCGEINIAESADLKRRKASLGVANFAHFGMIFLMHRGRAGAGAVVAATSAESFSGNGRGWSRCQRSLFLAITLLQLSDPLSSC
jgi:hypothetical protein